MKCVLVSAGIALVGLGVGCGPSTTSPASTASLGSPAGSAFAGKLHLTGYVSDTAFRPMGGVRVEIINGPDAGRALTSDANGRLSDYGAFASGVSMRATKDGYRAMTSTVLLLTTPDTAWVSFLLAPAAPPVQPLGNYTLTIAAGSACAGLPDAVRARSWNALITKHFAATVPADTAFDGTVSGSQFVPFSNIFWVGVAGNYLAVSTEGEGPSIVEQVGPQSYVAYSGQAGAVVDSADSPMIAAPFRGVIEYCELKTPMVGFYDCSDALAVVKVQCTVDNILGLTPR